MFRDVFISESLPRDLGTFNSTFIEGWQMYRFFGLLFMAGGIFLFLICLFKLKMYAPAIIMLVVAFGGFSMFRKANNRAAERKDIFLNGKVVYAKVIDHGKKLNYLKSSKDYTITVSVPENGSNDQVVIVNKREALWKEAPVQSTIMGLEYDGKYFFGEEMACHFKLFNKK